VNWLWKKRKILLVLLVLVIIILNNKYPDYKYEIELVKKLDCQLLTTRNEEYKKFYESCYKHHSYYKFVSNDLISIINEILEADKIYNQFALELNKTLYVSENSLNSYKDVTITTLKEFLDAERFKKISYSALMDIARLSTIGEYDVATDVSPMITPVNYWDEFVSMDAIYNFFEIQSIINKSGIEDPDEAQMNKMLKERDMIMSKKSTTLCVQRCPSAHMEFTNSMFDAFRNYGWHTYADDAPPPPIQIRFSDNGVKNKVRLLSGCLNRSSNNKLLRLQEYAKRNPNVDLDSDLHPNNFIVGPNFACQAYQFKYFTDQFSRGYKDGKRYLPGPTFMDFILWNDETSRILGSFYELDGTKYFVVDDFIVKEIDSGLNRINHITHKVVADRILRYSKIVMAEPKMNLVVQSEDSEMLKFGLLYLKDNYNSEITWNNVSVTD